ncbi:MAG: TolC family protein [Bacteroidales bacterium]|nr:TolC family protein [Bacteroidales bacterium]
MHQKSRYKKHFTGIFLVLAITAFSSSGNGQDNLTLNQAIQIGLQNNFQVLIFEQFEESARLNNVWGTVGRFPSVGLGLTNVNRFDNSPNTTNLDERDKTFTNGLTPYLNVNWLLFSGFGVKMAKDKLELLETLSEGNSALIVENTIQAIILGYYKVLLEEEKLKILEEVKKLSGDRYNYEMAKKELGSSVTFDVLQAKNSFYSDSTNYLLQKLNVKNAYLNLNLLLGEPAETQLALTDTFQVKRPDYNYDELENMMKSSNKNLLNQYVNQEILKKEIGIQKSAMYPVISMGAGADYNKYWYNDQNFDPIRNTNSFDYYANFTLSFNLFNGGNTRRAIEQAQISDQIGQLETKEMEQTLSNYLLHQFDLYFIRKQLYEVAEVNIESASLNLKISTEKYRNGSINSFNFRDVQLIYLNAAFRKLEAIYNLIDTRAELLRLTGGIVSEY